MSRRIGIEVGASAVRVAEVEVGGTPRLLGFAERELPRGAVIDGAVTEPEIVREAIAACLEEGRFRRRRRARIGAHLAIAGLRAITREIELPHLEDAELAAAARLQAIDIVPFPTDDAVLSVQRLGAVEGAKPPRDRVLLAAAHRDLVEPLVEASEAAGVVVLGVEFAPFAMVRALAEPAEEGAEAIVSVGADLTTVVIHDRGEPLLVRTIAGGSAAVTRAIGAALDLPFADAEAMKLNLATEDAGLPAEATAAARDASMALITEIRSSLQYYASLPGRGDCRAVVLTGGGAALAGFAERLAQQVAPPVIERDLLSRFSVRAMLANEQRLRRVGAAVVGTALPPGSGARTIDLLPPEVLARRHVRTVTHRVVAGAGLLAFGLAVIGGLRYLQVDRARAEVSTLAQSIAVLNRQIPRYESVAREHNQLLADSALALPLVSHEVNWPAVLAAIDAYTPASVSAGNLVGSVSTPAPSTTKSAPTLTSAAALPAPEATLGTISLTFTATSYPAFQQWFNEVTGSGRLAIVSFSGITASKSGVSFSAELAIEGSIHTSRLARFSVEGI